MKEYANHLFGLSHQELNDTEEEKLRKEWTEMYSKPRWPVPIPLLESSTTTQPENPFKRLPDPFDYDAIEVPEEFAKLRKPGQQPFWVHYSQKDQMLVLRTNQGRWLVNHIIPEGPVLWRTVEVRNSWPLRKIVMGWASRVPVRKDNNAYPQP